ncbi:MAG: zinc-ribbon domain-containing protein [Oscillospiraceae bacterium]|nr:zinc-ribbon domain-containing protein [Oscillospiraceae bacterium]
MNFCPSCGQQLAEDTRFCPKCGKTVHQTPTEEPAATNPQPTPEQAPQDATAAPQAQFPQESTTSPVTPEQAPQRPHKKKKKVLFIIAGVFVFLFIVIIALASGGNNDNPDKPTKPAVGAEQSMGQTIEAIDTVSGTTTVLHENKELSTADATVWDIEGFPFVSHLYTPGQETIYLYPYSGPASALIGMILRATTIYPEWTAAEPSLPSYFADVYTFTSFDEHNLPVYENQSGTLWMDKLYAGALMIVGGSAPGPEWDSVHGYTLYALVFAMGSVSKEEFDAKVYEMVTASALHLISNPDTPTTPATQAAGDVNAESSWGNLSKNGPVGGRHSDGANWLMMLDNPLEVHFSMADYEVIVEDEDSFFGGFCEAISGYIYGGSEPWFTDDIGLHGRDYGDWAILVITGKYNPDDGHGIPEDGTLREKQQVYEWVTSDLTGTIYEPVSAMWEGFDDGKPIM